MNPETETKLYRGPASNGDYLYYCGKLQKVQERYQYDYFICKFEDLVEITLEDIPETEHIFFCGLSYAERPIPVKAHNRRAMDLNYGE